MTARRPTQRAQSARKSATPTQAPAKPTKRVRPGRKTRKAGQPYDEATRAKVLETMAAHGLAEAHRRHKVPKSTLTRWRAAAGLDLGAAARARTANAVEGTRAKAAEVKLGTVDLLEQHIAQAGDYLATVAGINALAARAIVDAGPDGIDYVSSIAGPVPVLTDRAAAEVKKIADALGTLPLVARDAEGILTRAIHDLQLLRGEATERGELVVEFNVPRPIASERDVLEVPALEE